MPTMSQHDNVSNSIFSILAAFTNGLNVFKKLREQKVKDERKRTARTTRRDGRKKDPPVQGQSKTTVHHGTIYDDRRRKAENQLSKSLREGSRSIRTEYENGYEKAGRVFETGDVIAKASLTDTLLKLNTGLVGIISSFLDNGRKDPNLDFDKLTLISDQVRSETLLALSDLYQRLSTSNLDLKCVNPINKTSSSCQSRYQAAAEMQARSGDQSYQKRPSRQAVNDNKKKQFKTVTIARVPIKNSSTKQLAIIRPRERRQTSFSSSSSGNSRTSSGTAKSTSTTVTIPDPSMTKLRASPGINSQPAISDAFKSGSINPPEKGNRAPGHGRQEKKLSKCSAELRNMKMSCKSNSSLAPNFSQELGETPAITSVSQSEPLYSRRASKPTPSFYSIVTDSTKIGEIPFHKQIEPPDLDQMDRLNAEAVKIDYDYCRLADEPAKSSGRSRFLPKTWRWKRCRSNPITT